MDFYYKRYQMILDKIQTRIELAFDRTKKPEPFSFEWFLRYLSVLYSAVVNVRFFLYEKKILKQKSLPCFVISIGNIVVGGTGKTPMVIYLARTLKTLGKTPVVISRGYKGRYKSETLVVSDGRSLLTTAEACGDEPYMLAQKLDLPVVVGKDRFKAGQRAIQEFNPDIIILDDGFQHLNLKRDLDLLLFDYKEPMGNGQLLPAGRLRETVLTAKKRGHGIVLTRCTETGAPKKNHPIHTLSASFKGIPCFQTAHVPYIGFLSSSKKEHFESEIGTEYLKGRRALLFSGIAKNSSFYQSMDECSVNIVYHFEFQDHYSYKASDFEAINKKAVELGADIILTTEKDWVKADPDVKWEKEVAVIGIRIEFELTDAFQEFLKKRIKLISPDTD